MVVPWVWGTSASRSWPASASASASTSVVVVVVVVLRIMSEVGRRRLIFLLEYGIEAEMGHVPSSQERQPQ